MKYIYHLLILSLFFIQCKKSESRSDDGVKVNDSISNSKNLNVSIMIDLSDRIDPEKYPNPSMEYYQRDLEYIKAIKTAFIGHVKSKKVIQLDDQMQIFFNPEPSDPQINDLTKELKVSFDKNTSKGNINIVDERYASLPAKIYHSAIQDKKYVGSDIWGFFKNKVEDYCVKDKHRNILFILTDGYMFHKDSKFSEENKTSYLTPELVRSLQLKTSDFKAKIEDKSYGFIKANDDLGNLEIIVIGINPEKGNPFEGDVIKTYWENWFKEMNITKYQVKDADLPSNLEPVIKQFILNK
ncbi:hypothetical protein [Epilithonimonas hungarica]|jgi:hypothetical protein|uniref:VWFA domain-containing protein n=1 Tax=Epilithonimonas hungarica TaxID=454006 RepID=A0A1G7G428_9FLAO|nr:hypothetical protein [Epilithonimonas hungarica]MDP9956979.1 hypothetical protein [Epilithonimonas hungarica]SDE82926.1 hypothetical protein SAMN05421825_0325 [Epilithonimonas hungarica]